MLGVIEADVAGLDLQGPTHPFSRPITMDKLPEWDASKSDDPQYLMNMAKKFVVMDVLTANGGEATFGKVFEKAEELHCDVVTAALNSMKRKKVLTYDKEMGLLHPNDDAVVIKLLKPDFDCFA